MNEVEQAFAGEQAFLEREIAKLQAKLALAAKAKPSFVRMVDEFIAQGFKVEITNGAHHCLLEKRASMKVARAQFQSVLQKFKLTGDQDVARGYVQDVPFSVELNADRIFKGKVSVVIRSGPNVSMPKTKKAVQ